MKGSASSPRPSVAALLLAGGRSTRMGSPKALLDWGGRPLWRHQADTLDELDPDERYISLPPGLPLDPSPWCPVVDRSPDLGPLGGIEAALRAMRSDWLAVLAIDLPAMTADYLRARLNEALVPTGVEGRVPRGTGTPGAERGGCGVIAADAGRYLGLAGIYPRGVLPLVEAAVAGEDRSLQHLARAALAAGLLEVRPLTAAERPFFRNVNRPGD